MKLLELFSGTGSISRAFESYGFEVRTLDMDPRHKATYIMDIMDFSPEVLGGWNPDVVWASPDCTCWSVTGIGRNWVKSPHGVLIPKNERAAGAVAMVQKTLQTIKELDPAIWYIENPVGMLRTAPFMKGLYRKTVTYCQYGDIAQKPTDIWTNNSFWTPRPRCTKGDPCHEAAPRGSKKGTQGKKDSVERAKIPDRLCEEIALSSILALDMLVDSKATVWRF